MVFFVFIHIKLVCWCLSLSVGSAIGGDLSDTGKASDRQRLRQ